MNCLTIRAVAAIVVLLAALLDTSPSARADQATVGTASVCA